MTFVWKGLRAPRNAHIVDFLPRRRHQRSFEREGIASDPSERSRAATLLMFSISRVETLGEPEGIRCSEHLCLFDNNHVNFDYLIWIHFTHMHSERFVMLVERFLGGITAVDERVVSAILLADELLDFLRLAHRHAQVLDHLFLP